MGGSDLECLILAVPDKLLEARQWDRLEKRCRDTMGMTLDELIEKMNREKGTSTTREDLGKCWCGSSHLRHLDLAQDGGRRVHLVPSSIACFCRRRSSEQLAPGTDSHSTSTPRLRRG